MSDCVVRHRWKKWDDEEGGGVVTGESDATDNRYSRFHTRPAYHLAVSERMGQEH